MDNRAQISAELIIIMAAILAVAIVLVTNLKNTAGDASKKLSSKSDELLSKIDKITGD